MESSIPTSIPKSLAVDVGFEIKRRKALQPDAESCKFFISEYLKTFDPRPDVETHDLDFHLYDYEEELVDDLVEAILTGFDEFIEKSRDMGVSWTVLAVFLWAWLCLPGFQALVGSRKEDYVDNGQLDSLFGKLDYLIRTIKDPELLPIGFDIKKHRTYMKLINPVNGNTILGESANKNFSRAGRYSAVFFDEFGFWPDAKNSWQAAGDATKCRLAVTTPPNDPSYAKAIRFGGKINILTLHWSRHPKKDQAWYEEEKKRRTEDEILHEIDISWEYAGSGRPYPEADNLEFDTWPYEPMLPLYLSLDLGLDGFSMGWYQPVRNSDRITLLEAYENNQRPLEWYYPFFGLDIDSNAALKWPYKEDELDLIRKIRLWPRAIVFGDPSGKQRHIESGISAYSKLKEKGIFVQTNEKENNWVARRDETKRLLGRLRINDTPGTRWWHECVKSSRYPKREETSQATSPIALPIHDWTSHHRTQSEFFAVNYKGEVKTHVGLVTSGVTSKPKSFIADDEGKLVGLHIDLNKAAKESMDEPRNWMYN